MAVLSVGVTTSLASSVHFRLPVDALDILGADIPRVPCGCGHRGCIENYISGRGFEWMYSHFYQHTLPATDIIAHYAAGEPKAVAHVERFMDVLAVCLGNLLTMLGSPFGRGGWGVV